MVAFLEIFWPTTKAKRLAGKLFLKNLRNKKPSLQVLPFLKTFSMSLVFLRRFFLGSTLIYTVSLCLFLALLLAKILLPPLVLLLALNPWVLCLFLFLG